MKIHIEYEQDNKLVICLNVHHRFIAADFVFKGGLYACIIDPITLFRKAIKHNAYAFFVAHNHPSGELSPSKMDIELWEHLQKAGDLLQLECLDCIIFNERQFYSMGYL